MENILEFKQISKYYPGVTALNHVSLEIKKGEVHALVGENGAGKSTLIKTCSGAIQPSEGEIVINGKTFKSLTPRLSEENGIGDHLPGIQSGRRAFGSRKYFSGKSHS